MELLKHPNDKDGFPYYQLKKINQRYWLQGMNGELRSCPQRWAKQIEQGKDAKRHNK